MVINITELLYIFVAWLFVCESFSFMALWSAGRIALRDAVFIRAQPVLNAPLTSTRFVELMSLSFPYVRKMSQSSRHPPPETTAKRATGYGTAGGGENPSDLHTKNHARRQIKNHWSEASNCSNKWWWRFLDQEKDGRRGSRSWRWRRELIMVVVNPC